MLSIAILAAGKGSRMKSSLPKVLHKLSGKTLLQRVLDSCNKLKPDNLFIIVGHKYKEVEDSLFENPIGPAFVSKLEYDMKMDNGLNANESKIKKVKVIKIKAVLQIDENSYSEEKEYWFNTDTGIVYDFENDYVIGRISRDENGNYLKLNEKIYIVNTIIDIPEFKLYE